ncbi:MAG: CDP-alcohol phosphatidyltransferase family protein [Actinobacteria bacterium]|nr:CDP-alcohol phosphatidyltransferase family protein [Actinomycetota bacterium]
MSPEQNGTGQERPQRGGQLLSDAARDRLIESRLTPNAISMVGLIGNLAAVAFIFAEMWIPAGFAFVFGSVMDLLDGKYSRMSGKATLFGAFLDSSLDRLEEGLVLAAVAWQFARSGDEAAAMAVVLAVLGSLMVSYTRARAEALGIECKVGIATRAIRVVIVSAGLFLADITIDGTELAILKGAIYLLAGLTMFTMLQRIWHVYRQSKVLDAQRAAAA